MDKSRKLLIEGSAGSGKTLFAVHKVILYALQHEGARIGIFRQTLPSLKETSWLEIRNLLYKYKIPFDENKSEGRIKLNNDAVLQFKSLDNPEKIRSLNLDMVYVEQAEEVKEESYFELEKRIRGPASREDYGQFLLVVTPATTTHWIYDLFHRKGVKNSSIVHFHYTENPFLDEVYMQEYEELKDLNYDLYVKYTLGEWGNIEGLIFEKWDNKMSTRGYEYYTFGIDFGYNHPNCFLLIGWLDGEPYVLDEHYKRNELNEDFIKQHDLKPEDLYQGHADSAAPDKIEQFRNARYNVIPAKKDTVQSIDTTKSVQIHIDEKCVNTLKEIKSWCYKTDKDNNTLEEPVKINDHAMDALRYDVYGNLGPLSGSQAQIRYEHSYAY